MTLLQVTSVSPHVPLLLHVIPQSARHTTVVEITSQTLGTTTRVSILSVIMLICKLNCLHIIPALGHDKAQSIIDQITSVYESTGGPPAGGFGFGPQHLTGPPPPFGVPPMGFGGPPPFGPRKSK